ncbi:LuxR C-terminal-related transcriptional regulator [Phaeodactylibacter sp.]|uniref:LuxR C-terminal-related transcriptional regulator n=1 Tax=Phaeodactylibacter sp. TaxID=1940289 RepID=UPI00260020BC|nr:LuxR C-terminal-related transcriptional regulator [Phaeodactylibacter sp.]MCI4648941.1 LuxR C-terminal-related transcriptional regulator [Phaeodactylibacter sp.]MCI5091820.1 LuxR C-terminal-related transcriptional regulator [Phaeodactylibacter sp.]
MKPLSSPLHLTLLALLLSINLWAVEDCTNWLKGENISKQPPKKLIIQLYDLMREEDEHFLCLIDYYRNNHLTTPEYKQLFYNFMGQYYNNTGKFDSARAYILLAIGQDSLLTDNAEALPADLATLGNTELFQRNYHEALEYYQKALDAVDWNGRPFVIANTFATMGVCYVELEMPGNALAHFSTALEYSIRDTTLHSTGRRLMIRHNIGVVHNIRGQHQRALEVLEPLVDSMEHIDYPYLERLLHSSIGYAYLETGELELAEQHLKTLLGDEMNFDINQEELYYYLLELYAQQNAAHEMKPILDAVSAHYQELGIPPLFEHFYWSGRYHELSKQDDQAEALYREGLSYIPEDSFPANRARFYEALAALYQSTGQWENAYQYQTQHVNALLEQQEHDQNRAAEDIAVAYEVKEYRTRAEEAIARENLSLVRADLAERKALYFTWAVAFSILTILLLGFNYWQYRQRSKSKQEAIRERNKRLAQEQQQTRQQLEYQKTAVLDKSLWAARLKPKVSEAITRYHKRPDYLERKIHQIFMEEDILPQFEKEFQLFYPDFSRSLIRDIPNLTDKQLRYAMLIALGLSNKEIAEILSVSVKAVEMARYRLRSALEIEQEDSLEALLRNHLLYLEPLASEEA